MSVDTVGLVKEALANNQIQIEGIVRSFAQAPKSIAVTDMPLMFNLTGDMNIDETGDDYGIETREYQMVLIGLPQGAGGEGEAEAVCEPFFALVRDWFQARPHLGVDFVQTSKPMGDSGVKIINFANMPYYGIIFRLSVTSYFPINYEMNTASGELDA